MKELQWAILDEIEQHREASYGDVEVQLIFDRENGHYQLFNVGWNKDVCSILT